MTRALRISAFGFRSFPPSEGSAGADKFALELLPRLARRGHQVVAYNRVYPGASTAAPARLDGVKIISARTVRHSGFDTLVHSTKVTFDIIAHNRADIVHIQNGGNSLFGAILRLFGKKTYLSQDGPDWRRDKWPWYGKLFLWLSSHLTARVHNAVIFDNVFARREFEKRFRRKFDFVPFGANVEYNPNAETVLAHLGLTAGDYFLFVGRFIPDKGLHWLVPAFAALATSKKLVLVGGAPNPSSYARKICQTTDKRVIFAGYIYGSQVHALMRNAFAFVQPSAIEGLSPAILEAAFLGAPVICTDIEQNRYGLGSHGIYFQKGDVADLTAKMQWALDEPRQLAKIARAGARRVTEQFNWDRVVDQHIEIFRR
ncbi:MAG: glycosyltransferase family 4 protein [Alphaproteobacteria bacterium]